MIADARSVRLATALAALLLAGAAQAADDSVAGGGGLAYRLNGGFVNLSTPGAVQLPLRVSSDFGLLPRGQELMLSTTPSTQRLPDWMQSVFPSQRLGAGFDNTRATYRYTVLASDAWAWKVGLTASLADSQPAFGLWRLGTAPMMHLSGSGRFGGWTLSLDADGMQRSRGRALDLDLQVDYGLGRDLSLYGGYRMIETAGDVEDYFYGAPPSNTANVGIRFRF